VKLFFLCSHKGIERDEAEKIAFPSFLPHFPLSTMHEAVGEAALLNIFLKQLSFTNKVAHEAILKKQLH
jgi:hypothetical protein